MNKVLFWINTILIVVLVLDVSWQVLSRYVASSPSTFTDELARYLMVWMGFLGGAYMFGKLFGKHKLAPKVSPGKTWQGFIGGLATAAVISWGYGMWANLDVAPVTLLICSIVAALASVLGDLTESMFKREAGIKDSGHLIPGHGGILDRIDSLTAAVPVFACLLLLVFRTL